MNARLYDPVLGRFVSPDPYVADPTSAQAFNWYMYVGNNPLMFTDPTGERRRPLENTRGEEPMPEGALETWDSGIHFYQRNTEQSYFYNNGRYYYGNKYSMSSATEVGWNEVKYEYVFPNSTTYYSSNDEKSSSNSSAQGFGVPKGAARPPLESHVDKIRASEIYAKETSEQDNNYNFFYKRKDLGLRFSAEYIDDGGVGGNTIVINAHGAPTFIEAPTASGTMDPQQLHEYLLSNNKLYHESYTLGTTITVRLEACKTGSGFAQIFSGFNPHMNVVAPNHNIQNVFLFWNYVVSEGQSKGQYLEFFRGK